MAFDSDRKIYAMLAKHGYMLSLIIGKFFVQTVGQRVQINQKRMTFTAVYVLLHISPYF